MGLRILLVDDDPDMRDIIRIILEHLPEMTVVGEAEHGLAALLLVPELGPDVICMDMVMPYLDGIEATRRIVAAFPETAIVGLSSESEAHRVRAMMEAGACAFIPKHRVGTDLVKTLQSFL